MQTFIAVLSRTFDFPAVRAGADIGGLLFWLALLMFIAVAADFAFGMFDTNIDFGSAAWSCSR